MQRIARLHLDAAERVDAGLALELAVHRLVEHARGVLRHLRRRRVKQAASDGSKTRPRFRRATLG
eukprot:5384891-Pleurochrysis_carterae.AAC.4